MGLDAWVNEDGIDQAQIESRKKARRIILECKLNNEKFLNLDNLGLTSLPIQIGDLTSVKNIRARKNKLKSLPESFTNLKKLESVNFSENQFEFLPELLVNLKELTFAYFAKNQIKSVPDSFGNCQKLSRLDLGFNQIKTINLQFFENYTQMNGDIVEENRTELSMHLLT